jgi:outer membrane protein W
MKTSLRLAALLCLVVSFAAHAGDWYNGFYFRAGGLYLLPASSSGPVTLSNVTGNARLALDNGPIAGSGSGVGSAFLPAVTVGYTFWDQFSVETIIAVPPTLQLTATGTMATQPLAPYALGNLPTGVAALGANLGQTKVLPPVLTVTYKFLPEFPVRPYVGLGGSILYSYDTQITNPVLTAVHPVTLNLPAKAGFVVQGGLDVKIWRQLFFTLDAKYIAGMDLDVTMTNLDVKVPGLPLYGQVHVGDASVHVSVNPFVFQAGAGWNF